MPIGPVFSYSSRLARRNDAQAGPIHQGQKPPQIPRFQVCTGGFQNPEHVYSSGRRTHPTSLPRLMQEHGASRDAPYIATSLPRLMQEHGASRDAPYIATSLPRLMQEHGASTDAPYIAPPSSLDGDPLLSEPAASIAPS